ncbi:hypothetical protein AB0K51_11225 [Kitasatospora sp. NPDC049285]|uniref:hypothetical protein n=1 Tax=Kitasatospora sp. NPDC049285 TaxID=3157096 RepID=UPI003446041A
MRRNATGPAAMLLAAALLSACGPDGGTAPAPTRTLQVGATAYWGGDVIDLQSAYETRQPDGRPAVGVLVAATLAGPATLASVRPHYFLETHGQPLAELTGPAPWGENTATVSEGGLLEARDLGGAGQQLHLEDLSLVITAPGKVRAVLPLVPGAPGAEPLAPVPLHASADILATGRYRLALHAAELRGDCTLNVGGGNLPGRPVSALDAGRHTVTVQFDVPFGTTGDGLALRLTLPDGRTLAPTGPLNLMATGEGIPGSGNLAAWFDFDGPTAGRYTLTATDAGAAPAAITLE